MTKSVRLSPCRGLDEMTKSRRPSPCRGLDGKRRPSLVDSLSRTARFEKERSVTSCASRNGAHRSIPKRAAWSACCMRNGNRQSLTRGWLSKCASRTTGQPLAHYTHIMRRWSAVRMANANRCARR
jgi:hypothetical protein